MSTILRQAKPNPKLYQVWVEFADGRPPIFFGNSRTAWAAEKRVSFRQYMAYKLAEGRVFIHCPDPDAARKIRFRANRRSRAFTKAERAEGLGKHIVREQRD